MKEGQYSRFSDFCDLGLLLRVVYFVGRPRSSRMSGVDPDLFLRDELEFELRARGRNPKGAVTVLRKQLREALSAGDMLSAVDIRDKDRELEFCLEKWGELKELSRCVDSFESGPGSSCLLYTSRCV